MREISYDERLQALGYQPKKKKNSFNEFFEVYKSDCFNLKRIKETIFAFCLSFKVCFSNKIYLNSCKNYQNFFPKMSFLVSDMQRYFLWFSCWNNLRHACISVRAFCCLDFWKQPIRWHEYSYVRTNNLYDFCCEYSSCFWKLKCYGCYEKDLKMIFGKKIKSKTSKKVTSEEKIFDLKWSLKDYL